MKYCQNCGAELFDQALMCPKCKTVFSIDSNLVNSATYVDNFQKINSDKVLPYTVRNLSCFKGELEERYSLLGFIKFSFSAAKLMKGTDVILEEKEIKFLNRILNYADIRDCYIKRTDIPSIFTGFGNPLISIVIKTTNETISLTTFNQSNSEFVSKGIADPTENSLEKAVYIINSKIQGD